MTRLPKPPLPPLPPLGPVERPCWQTFEELGVTTGDLSSEAHLADGGRIALPTLHVKERVLATVLEPGLGGVLQRIDDFDTDTLGSFTRETPRAGTQIEAARKKARIGMARTGLRCGLGSKDAFGADPFAGLIP